MTSSENFGNKMNYLFKRMNSFLSFKKIQRPSFTKTANPFTTIRLIPSIPAGFIVIDKQRRPFETIYSDGLLRDQP